MNIFSNVNSNLFLAALFNSIIGFIPRLIGALLVFILGKFVADSLAKALAKIIQALNLKKAVDSFHLGINLPEESQTSLAHLVSLLVRYLVFYITLILCLDLLGLTGVASFLKGLTTVLPTVFSAGFILLLGLIAAGLVEAAIKKALLPFDPATARFSGKVSSYVVIGFFVLMALAELGVASFFINTLFIGFVATLTLAFGLSLGLGSKDFVTKTMDKWSTNRSKKKTH